jgi:hypothetical protein
MNKELSSFAARLCKMICEVSREGGEVERSPSYPSRSSREILNREFSRLALELFGLQFKYNAPYQKVCQARGATPKTVGDWTQIPAVPTTAFKELELSCLSPDERTTVFYSSGTTEQKPSRHFHCAESLGVYEASLWSWFEPNVLAGSRFKVQSSKLIVLTPSLEQAPHSSLVHMFETVRRKLGASKSPFVGQTDPGGAWILNFDAAVKALKSATGNRQSAILLGTAFSFVHLLDFLGEHKLQFQLPPGSRVMETGGYKNRSRTMPKGELHALITERLGIPAENIVCEYGMSELSSQAYHLTPHPHIFHFPPWVRVQIISPENGREVAEGETGLIRVFDLANVFSVMAVQTEDLGVRRSEGFELIGRTQPAEPRGCSLMNA